MTSSAAKARASLCSESRDKRWNGRGPLRTTRQTIGRWDFVKNSDIFVQCAKWEKLNDNTPGMAAITLQCFGLSLAHWDGFHALHMAKFYILNGVASQFSRTASIVINKLCSEICMPNNRAPSQSRSE
jgi:hypothetical protein